MYHRTSSPFVVVSLHCTGMKHDASVPTTCPVYHYSYSALTRVVGEDLVPSNSRRS